MLCTRYIFYNLWPLCLPNLQSQCCNRFFCFIYFHKTTRSEFSDPEIDATEDDGSDLVDVPVDEDEGSVGNKDDATELSEDDKNAKYDAADYPEDEGSVGNKDYAYDDSGEGNEKNSGLNLKIVVE